MICHNLECIFIHIPKCAGTSIETALGYHDGFEGRGMQDHRALADIKPPAMLPDFLTGFRRLKYHRKHLLKKLGYKKFRNIRNADIVSHKQYQNYFRFSFVRNPWDRYHSYYRAILRDDHIRQNWGLPKDISFEDFAQAAGTTGPLMPQLDWIRDHDGNLDMDFVGKFENLAEDWQHVCARLGIDKPLPHKLKGGNQSGRDAYSPELRDLIGQWYEEEIEYFGYCFDE